MNKFTLRFYTIVLTCLATLIVDSSAMDRHKDDLLHRIDLLIKDIYAEVTQ